MTGKIDWRKELPYLELYENEPLCAHTTFHIGGAAAWLLCPQSVEEAANILRLCKDNAITPFFLGNGSNILAPDGGYDGVILATSKLDRMTVEGNELIAQSGVLLAKLANFAAQNALSGLEFAQGIPGSVGGGMRMNAGAYGGELAQVVKWVEVLDEAGETRRIPSSACKFAYRHSLFCEEPLLVTAVCFVLTPGNENEIREKMAELAQRRREKQPLEYPSAGSTFKRPQGHFAAALIDQCGLKGLQVGGARVSEKHAGFVVNVGNATAADVLAVIEQVKTAVKAQTGVTLEPEVEILR